MAATPQHAAGHALQSYSVDRQNVDATVAFIRAYMTNRNDPALNRPPLAYNAWHYLLMGGNTKKKGKEKMQTIY